MGDTTPTDRSHLGYGAAVAALVFWGAQAVIAKGIDIDPLPLVFLRIWMAVAFSIGILLLSGNRLDKMVLRYSFLGGIAFGLDLVFFFTSLKLTTVANATIIPSMQPVLLVFAAPILFQERIDSRDVGLAAIALAGVALVVFGASGLPEWSPAGDLWAVATLFAWTSYFMASAILAAVFLGEDVTGVQATGMFVTVGSLAYITLRTQAEPPPQLEPA